jgi:hypothetical protein
MVGWSDIYTDTGGVRKRFKQPRQARGIAVIDPHKIDALAQEIQIIPQFMRAASKQAATETIEAFKQGIGRYGIRPRFNAEPETFPYDFSKRKRRTRQTPYHHSGDSFDTIMARKPRMRWSGAGRAKLTASLSILGGNINRLRGAGQRNVVSGYAIDSYTYTNKFGTLVRVDGRRRYTGVLSFTPSPKTYKQEWAYTINERVLLTREYKRRLSIALRGIAFRQFTKTGKVKKGTAAKIERGGT